MTSDNLIPGVLRSRTVRLFVLAVVFAGLSSCGDGTGPGQTAAITRVAGDQQPGVVNAPLSTPLSVRVTGAGGSPMEGVTVTWTVTSGGGSVSPATSVTDAQGIATTTWTLGAAAGEQKVTASVNGVSTTFTALASELVACDAVIDLPVGGACLALPARAASVEVNAGSSLAEFVAIPYHDGNFTRLSTSVSASATGTTAISGPPTPTFVPSSPLATLDGVSAALLPDLSFESRLRRRERTELLPLMPAAAARREDAVRGQLGARYTTVPGDPRFVVEGDILTLNTNSEEGLAQACSVAVNKQGRVRKISAHAIIVEDLENPAPGFTAADYEEIASTFEAVVWPSDVEAFGSPTDIDGNQRVIMFYTVEVNKLTPPDEDAFVGGFFHSRDLFPKSAASGLGGCPTSNVAEMFYMLAPDESRNFSKKDNVKRMTPGAIAHELQHLINSSRRLYLNPGAPRPLEQVWLDEGLAHIAEELAYYKASGFAPGRDIDSLDARQRLDALNTYQVANLGRFRRYVLATNSQSPFGETSRDDDLESRGAIWSFLRWAADHRGTAGDGDTWMRLAQSADTGVRNLRGVFGTTIGSRGRDWAAAHYLDNAVTTVNPAFTHPSWNFRSVIPLFELPREYPLNTIALGSEASVFQLVDGGAAYLRFGVPAGTRATVRITTTSGGQLPSGASVWFVRTK